MRIQKNKSKMRRVSGLAAMAAAISSATPVWAGTSGAGVNPGANAVTISMSGSTAMRNFTISSGFSLLNPGDSITLLSGVSGAPVTYQAATGASTSVQLAAGDFTSGVDANPAVPGAVTTANYAALRLEWHEQGSVEGIFELADAQIDDGIYSNNPTLNPNGAIATFVNRNKWLGTSPPGVALGVSQGGHLLNGFANANDRTTSQIQNRVQMAITDVNAAQGFSRAGTGVFNLTPGMNGYGKGNPALTAAGNVSGIGLANSRHALLDETQLNMTTGTIDPGTIPGNVGSGGTTYASGPWNSAGVGNLHNERVAITATTFAANAGTGLTRINRSDAQWLQSTGRLANGADFNVTTRDVNSGTLNVAASNVGLDPSWAAGENDGGTGGGTTEDNLGTGVKFANKSSGGSNLRPTVQNSRMAIGHLSLSDYRGGGSNNGNRPTRALDYRDDADDLSNGSNGSFPDPGTGSSTTTVGEDYQVSRSGFAPVNAYNIVNGNYAVWQNETYVTAKDVTQGATVMSQFVTDYTAAEGGAPTAQQQADLWAGKKITGGGGRTYTLNDNPTVKTVVGLDTTYGTSIKGDNHSAGGNDVYDVRKNILGAVANFPAGSIANPADALINTSFILPQFMVVEKDRDGVGQNFANPSYNPGLSNTFLGSASLALNFDTNGTTTAVTPKGPADVTVGDGTSTYGNVSPTQGAILIIDNSGSTKANWMFGNFRQNLVRDYAAVKAAADAQIALQGSGLGVDMFAGAAGSNNTAVSGVAAALQNFHGTSNAFKGDLIAMGDYNSDGRFDGKDLYLLARGAALSDAAGVGSGYATGELTTFSGGIANDFGDWVRRGVLRKNDALDYMAGAFGAGTAQAIAASANLANDPTGANAFNKRDVNRDGLVNFVDAVTSDKFFNKNYTNLQNQLDATGNVRDWESPTPLSLIDVELNDTGNINQSDLDVINTALTGVGSETWATGTLIKSGAGTVSVAYTTAGTIKVNAGATLLINSGTVDAGGTVDIFTDNSGTGTNGNHVAVINNATSSLIISAGGKSISTLNGVGNTSVSAGASLTTDYARQAGLTVNGTLNIRPTISPNTNPSVVNTLAVGAAGKVDISNQSIIAHSTPVGTWAGTGYTGLTGYVATGRNTGNWDGPGIVTSQSGAIGSNLYSVGVAKGTEVLAGRGLSPGDTTVWAGQTISGSDSLVMFTYGGDSNLDGKLSVDDYIAIDVGIAAYDAGNHPEVASWSNGDFNYDGKVGTDDYLAVIDLNYPLAGPTGSLPQIPNAGGIGGALGVTAVPEPGAVGLLGAVAALSLRHGSRRRRR